MPGEIAVVHGLYGVLAFALPAFASLPRFEPAISDSSFHLVAGAPVVAEKKQPGFVIDFAWRIDAAKPSRLELRMLDVNRCAA